ncbi:uncharacterized protein B0I36DRAFT_431233 [Microdochium trichocladiopsis]|uniref:Uncharacterized protein n=1 Tax=Microdochium trichocladiopsis TaxID=1682393 RepID=A0A9P9BQM3_9PEZI|nr:uncharacterized protein B0I36DRAFT_431233 [Microdochium trichocladiopsis]KAH7031038.1 hypothetical protein B0I36DRAFT_431233 [Microdochium trichocladiopsis]
MSNPYITQWSVTLREPEGEPVFQCHLRLGNLAVEFESSLERSGMISLAWLHYKNLFLELHSARGKVRTDGQEKDANLILDRINLILDSIINVLIIPNIRDRIAPAKPQSRLLRDWLYPEQAKLLASFHDDAIRVCPVEGPYPPPGISLDALSPFEEKLNKLQLPYLSSSQVSFPPPSNSGRDPLYHGPRDLLTKDGQLMFCMGIRLPVGQAWETNVAELGVLCLIEQAIRDGKLQPDARVPRLRGLLIDEPADNPEISQVEVGQRRLLGVLVDPIGPKRQEGGSMLKDMADPYLRQHGESFKGSIRTTLKGLHRARITWLGAHQGNVLVTEDDNVMLTGFGRRDDDIWANAAFDVRWAKDCNDMEDIDKWLNVRTSAK